jgi:hypothetical protein
MWFRIRKATIDPALRQTFEQHGVGTMQTLLAAAGSTFVHQASHTTADGVRYTLLAWLTEQYDRAERKETWNLTMEAAIVVLIVLEIGLAIMGLAQHSRL